MVGTVWVESASEWFAVLALAGAVVLTMALHGMRTRNAGLLLVAALLLICVSAVGMLVYLVGLVVWVPLGIAGAVMLVRRKRYTQAPPIDGIAPPLSRRPTDENGPTA